MVLRTKQRAELAKYTANKENLKGQAQCEMELPTAHGASPSTPAVLGQDARKHKSRSSLASSYLQAHGYVNRVGPNGENYDSSSQSGGGYTPQKHGLEHRSQLPVTPLHNGPPDFNFPTEVRQDHHGPSYSSRSGIPQYDGAWDDMAELIDFDHKDSRSGKRNISGGTSKHANVGFDTRGLTVADFRTTNQRFPAGHEESVVRFFQMIREREEQIEKQEVSSQSS